MKIYDNGQTQKMLNSIKEAKDLGTVMNADSNNPEICIAYFLNEILKIKDLKKSEIIRKADLERTYGYEIFRGVKQPSRNIILRLLLVFTLELEDVQYILKNSGYPILYPKRKRDALIIYCFNKKKNTIETNQLLFDNDLDLL